MLKLKIFVAHILANDTTGKILSFLFRQRIPFHNLTIDVSDPVITDETKALLFWRIYEKAEVTFVKKYLGENDDVIELGSSIGVMGSIVSHIQKTGKFISVEANTTLINANRKNLALNRKTDYVLLNKAVDYVNDTVSFSISKNTLGGNVDRSGSKASTITVETIKLDEICNNYNLANFTLISDIEGAEITFLLDDESALKKCNKIVIELHNTEYNGNVYLIKDMVDLIISHDFILLDQHGSVYVFQKRFK